MQIISAAGQIIFSGDIPREFRQFLVGISQFTPGEEFDTLQVDGGPIQVPAGKFSTILADPPWGFQTYSDKGKGRSAEAHYDCMPLDVIKTMPVGAMALPNAMLFLWTTFPHLEHGLEVIRAWDFTYKTIAFVWAKTRPACKDAIWLNPASDFPIGTGYYTRANPEICLLGTRGKPEIVRHDVRNLIIAPRREHSRKPDEIYERIEALCRPPYLELFARDEAPVSPLWTRWMGKAASTERRWRSDSYPGADTEPEAPGAA
jgi:N6-adenosine-specific RNA methylase IME4